jgi:hypothetical protein
VKIKWYFGRIYRLHLPGTTVGETRNQHKRGRMQIVYSSTLNMVVIYSSETLVDFRRNARHYIPEDDNIRVLLLRFLKTKLTYCFLTSEFRREYDSGEYAFTWFHKITLITQHLCRRSKYIPRYMNTLKREGTSSFWKCLVSSDTWIAGRPALCVTNSRTPYRDKFVILFSDHCTVPIVLDKQEENEMKPGD